MGTSGRRGRSRLLIAAAVVVVVVLVGCGSPSTLPAPAPSPSPALTPSSTPSLLPSASPSATVSPSPSLSPSAVPSSLAPSTPRRRALRRGDSGPAVLAMQQQLSAGHYWLGVPDGVFGSLTEQAVFALQKAGGLTRDGRVGTATSRALLRGVSPSPRSDVGRVVEIDLSRQLLLVVQDGGVLLTLNTSTGSGGFYVHDGSTRRAVTPRGHYVVTYEIDGLRVSPLGLLWRPKYFNGGIAVHGSLSVPPWPASHGCVRLSYLAIDLLWDEGLVPIGTEVWVY